MIEEKWNLENKIMRNISAGQIEEIHKRNIEEYETAKDKIAESRIEKFFNNDIKLGWKSILYEINKLPELDRTKYFQRLVEREKQNAIFQERNRIFKLNKLQKIKFILKGN